MLIQLQVEKEEVIGAGRSLTDLPCGVGRLPVERRGSTNSAVSIEGQAVFSVLGCIFAVTKNVAGSSLMVLTQICLTVDLHVNDASVFAGTLQCLLSRLTEVHTQKHWLTVHQQDVAELILIQKSMQRITRYAMLCRAHGHSAAANTLW